MADHGTTISIEPDDDVSLSGSPLQSAQATDRLSFSESTSNSAHTKETTNG